eukprot:10481399-Heterocapsa_arctica.AAC.1
MPGPSPGTAPAPQGHPGTTALHANQGPLKPYEPPVVPPAGTPHDSGKWAEAQHPWGVFSGPGAQDDAGKGWSDERN